jgi:tetratricopeptide (TPR) repeat protein
MLPRLVQWKPHLALGQVLLVPRPGREAEAVACAGGVVSIVASRLSVQVPGVNIEGGEVDLGDAGAVVRLSDGSAAELEAAARALAPWVEPAQFVSRDGLRGNLVSVGDPVSVTAVAHWAQPLRDARSLEALCEQLLPEGPPTLEALANTEELARLCPEAMAVHRKLGWLLMRLGRYEEALAPLELSIGAEAPHYVQAYVLANLGYCLDALGRSAEAVGRYERSVESLRVGAHRINLGMSCYHAGRFKESWDALRPYHAGRRLFEAAEMMERVGRHGDARALLRASLECEPSLLAPVPKNQWPKPPELGWIDRPELQAIVDAARATVNSDG